MQRDSRQPRREGEAETLRGEMHLHRERDKRESGDGIGQQKSGETARQDGPRLQRQATSHAFTGYAPSSRRSFTLPPSAISGAMLCPAPPALPLPLARRATTTTRRPPAHHVTRTGGGKGVGGPPSLRDYAQ